MVQPVPLSQVLGARVRQIREAKGLLQEDVAAAARGAGFAWARGTVAMLESGRRRLTLEEFFSLAQILEAAGAGDLWLEDLVPAEGIVFLSPLVGTATNVLRAMLRGESRLGGTQHSDDIGPVREAPEIPGTAEARALWRRAWPRSRPEDDPGTLYKVALASRGDAEIKAARGLRVSPVVVALAAESRWSRSLTEERDARVADHGNVSARTTQALRGHITRQLLDELRPLVKNIAKKKGRTRR